MPSSHTKRMYQQTTRGYHSVRQLAGSPRASSAGGHEVDTHVFRYMVNGVKNNSTNNIG